MSGLPDFVPPSAAKAAKPARAGAEVSSPSRFSSRLDRDNGTRFSSPSDFSNGLPAETDDLPLAAKLRALGCPIAFEVNGEVVFWLVADKEAARRASIDGAIFTAAEAEPLALFDAAGIRDLVRLKAALGGTLEPDTSQ